MSANIIHNTLIFLISKKVIERAGENGIERIIPHENFVPTPRGGAMKNDIG